MAKLVHAVMCGGSGTRLWPWSRRSYPKQFLKLVGDQSLLQSTVDRLNGLHADVTTIAMGNEEHRFLIAEHLRATNARAGEIVLEPVGRNTACVAIIAALRSVKRYGEDSLVLLSAADHYIADPAAYRNAIEQAIPIAQAGRVVTFGIRPDRPETGYGYIEIGEPLGCSHQAFAIASFREKPSQAVAIEYLASKNFLWNAGIFLFGARHLLDLAARLQPEMLDACVRACAEASVDLDFFRLAQAPFMEIEDISFDYAIMEKIGDRGAVIPVAMGWSDIGSWSSMRQLYGAGDAAGNVAKGAVELFDCSGVVSLSDGPLVVAHGLKEVIVVANHDAVYVAAAGADQDTKAVVAALAKHNRPQAVTHEKEYRPWGWYQTINLGNRFRVKEIVVNPGGRLSLQSHHHRAEHWVVVRGTARVTIGESTKLVTENESVFIPLGAKHRLENSGRIPMHLIEVQTGSYLEEDDIQRFDDSYGRS
ncbi:MAG TPA: mannose-1-phosphate guanylyltransferase/mannose-6-phosphate isomerase [Lacipirellulaceae bacterium]|nr:mannose-1-phosphate guanylyltransferase/mannose-6-phosphate isomerase [Lacipirellulaceae bacterium]